MAKKKQRGSSRKNDDLFLGIAIGAAATYFLLSSRKSDCPACEMGEEVIIRDATTKWQIMPRVIRRPTIGAFFKVPPPARGNQLMQLGVYRGSL